GAAEAWPVDQAAGEHAQLGGERGGLVAVGVEAPARPAPEPRRPHERSQPGVLAGAAVVERRRGDVADPWAVRGAQPVLPLLLVAVELAGLVEAPDAVEGAAADREVRAPGVRRVDVGGAEVEEGDRRTL